MTSKMNVIKVANLNKKENEHINMDNSFQKMPRLYLELLENKDKIKQNLVNQEYDPSDAKSIAGSFFEPQEKKIIEEEGKNEEEEEKDEEEEEKNEEEKNEEEEEEMTDITSEIEEEDDKSSMTYSIISSKEDYNVNIENKEETKKKLKELLSSSETFFKKEQEKVESDIPKLSELEKRGEVKTNKHIPTFQENYHPEEEDELKRELLFKFELLKKSYKDVSIPEFTMYSEYKNMSQTYENLLRQVTMDSNVQSYKSFLIGGFLLFEFVLGVWLKFDMSGFTQQQILNMNQYERLLIELGEKSYVPGGSQWPVEMRLLCMILFNAVVFVISKVVLKRTGQDMVNMMNTPFMSEKRQTGEKKKMKGPSIQFDDLNI